MYSEVCLLAIVLLSGHQSSALVDNRDTLYVLIALPLTNGSIRLADVNKMGAWIARDRIEKEGLIDMSLYKIDFTFINDRCDGTSALEGALAQYFNRFDGGVSILFSYNRLQIWSNMCSSFLGFYINYGKAG